MATSPQQKRRRKRLFDQDPHCYWCGVLLVQPVSASHKEEPLNMATLDHLNHAFDKDRKTPNDGRTPRTVLSCRGCNQARGAERIKATPIWELWNRSDRRPRYLPKLLYRKCKWWLQRMWYNIVSSKSH